MEIEFLSSVKMYLNNIPWGLSNCPCSTDTDTDTRHGTLTRKASKTSGLDTLGTHFRKYVSCYINTKRKNNPLGDIKRLQLFFPLHKLQKHFKNMP